MPSRPVSSSPGRMTRIPSPFELSSQTSARIRTRRASFASFSTRYALEPFVDRASENELTAMRAIGQVRRRPVLMTATRNQVLAEQVAAEFRDDHDVVVVDKLDSVIELVRRGARPQIILSDLSERDSVKMHSYRRLRRACLHARVALKSSRDRFDGSRSALPGPSLRPPASERSTAYFTPKGLSTVTLCPT